MTVNKINIDGNNYIIDNIQNVLLYFIVEYHITKSEIYLLYYRKTLELLNTNILLPSLDIFGDNNLGQVYNTLLRNRLIKIGEIQPNDLEELPNNYDIKGNRPLEYKYNNEEFMHDYKLCKI